MVPMVITSDVVVDVFTFLKRQSIVPNDSKLLTCCLAWFLNLYLLRTKYCPDFLPLFPYSDSVS